MSASNEAVAWPRLDKLQAVLVLAVLVLHPTDYAVDLGGERGKAERHVVASLGLFGKASEQEKPRHLYVTAADVLIGLGFGVYLLRRLLRRQWREFLRVPAPAVLLLVWFVLSAVPWLKPRGPGFTFSGKTFAKELIQAFEYFIAAYLLFEEGFRDGRMRRAAAVLLPALATVVAACAWVQYFDVKGAPSALHVSGTLATRSSLGAALALMVPFALGLGLFSGRWYMAAWGAALALAGLGVVLSGGAFMAIAAALLLLGALRGRWGFAVTGAVLTAVVAGLCMVPGLPRPNYAILEDSLLLYRRDDPHGALPWFYRVEEKLKQERPPAEQESWPWRQKYKEWQVALRMAGDSPLLGVGLGSFEANTALYYNKLRYDGRSIPKLEVDLMEPEAQNYYLQLAAGAGWPAVFLLLWLLVDHCRAAAAGLAARGWERGVAAGALGALAGVALVSVFAEPMVRGVGVTLMAVLALARGCLPRPEAAEPEAAPDRPQDAKPSAFEAEPSEAGPPEPAQPADEIPAPVAPAEAVETGAEALQGAEPAVLPTEEPPAAEAPKEGEPDDPTL